MSIIYNPMQAYARITGFSFIPGVNWFRTFYDFIWFVQERAIPFTYNENMLFCPSHCSFPGDNFEWLESRRIPNLQTHDKLCNPVIEKLSNDTYKLRSIAVLIYDPIDMNSNPYLIRLNDIFTIRQGVFKRGITTADPACNVMFGTVALCEVDNYNNTDGLRDFIEKHHQANLSLYEISQMYLGVDILDFPNIFDIVEDGKIMALKSWIYYIPKSELGKAEHNNSINNLPTILIVADNAVVPNSTGEIATAESIRSYFSSLFDKMKHTTLVTLADFNSQCLHNLRYLGNTMLCPDLSIVLNTFIVRDEVIVYSDITPIEDKKDLTIEELKNEVDHIINSEAFIDIDEEERRIWIEFYRSRRVKEFIPSLTSDKMNEIIAQLPYPDRRA